MTIASTPRKAGPLLGNGSATTFPFAFKVFSTADIQVAVADDAGVETVLTLGTDYSVTLNSNQETSPGGTVTYPVSGDPLPTGSMLSIIGDIDYDQPLDLPSGGNYSPLALENQLDRIAMQVQQLKEIVSRTLQLSVNSPSDTSTALPPPEANAIISWNATADGLQNVDPATLATIVAFGTAVPDIFAGTGAQTAFTLTANPGALGNLDVAVGGVTQLPGVDYFWTSGTSLSFAEAPADGVPILVRYIQALPQGTSDSAASTFMPEGTGAVARTVQAKLREYPRSLTDFSTPQQALTQGGAVLIPDGDTAITTTLSVTVADQAVEGTGRLLPGANSMTVVNAAVDVGRTKAKTISGLRIDGNGKTGVTGLSFGSVTNNPSAGAMEAVLYQSVRDSLMSNLTVGYDSRVSMEHSWDNVVAKLCTVGFKFYSDPINGGQNANSYRALRAQQNTVGVALQSLAAFPVHNNLFDGITLQSNTVCGFYAKGYSADGKVAALTLRGFHVEGNGTGASSVVVDGNTILKSDIHVEQTQVILADADLASGLSPCVIANDNSVVHAHNITGYGSPSGVVYQPDATSVVYESGLAVSVGVKFIETYGFLPNIGSMAVVGAPLIRIGMGRNDSTMLNPVVPDVTNTTGAVSAGNAWDADLGIVSQVTFAAAAGSTSSNRNYWYGGAVTSGESVFTSFLVKSSVNTTVRLYVLLNGAVLRTLDYPLLAGVARRVVLTGVATSTTGMEVYIFPQDSAGATLSFRGFQYLHTTDLSLINRHYHLGLVGARTLQYEACATPPTTTGVPRGFIVWSPTPTAATSPGSMNVSATTTPSWKALAALGA